MACLLAMWGVARAASQAETIADLQPPLQSVHVGGASADPVLASRLVSPLPQGTWTLPTGDLANTRYSPLDRITVENVHNLKAVATMATGVPHGHEGGPLVVGDTMYVITPFPNNLLAVDLTRPGNPIKWIFEPHPDQRAQGVACCDVVNRGGSFVDGAIVYATLDGQIIAVDATTGRQRWRTPMANVAVGETITMAPFAIKHEVVVGNSGGELGVRGWIAALDAKDGHIAWKAFNTGSDKDALIGAEFKPFYAKDRGTDLGLKTWSPDQWKLGGSTVWGWISYDQESNLLYYGTGNPGAWNADQRPGDNKWSSAIIARDADTGMARWAWQVSPHDGWDYDEIMENILVDMPWNGAMRKLLIHPGRTGFVFVLDRTTGELLSADKYEPTNWASGYDLKTGLPQVDPAKQTHFGKVVKNICPSSTGAKDFIPSAFSPRTGLVYIPAHNTCMDYEGMQANYIAGTPYLGADVRMYRGPGDYQGELVAWDPVRRHQVWGVREREFPVYSGVLATAGNVVFYGTMDGWFKAVDARNGSELWKSKTGSGIVGNPITFLGPDGQQYVAIYAGMGGWMGAVALPTISADDPYAALGTVGAMKDLKKVTGPGDLVYVFGF